MVQTYRRLGDLLISKGSLTNLQLAIALADQRLSNRRLGEILLERGFVSETQVATALAEQYGYPLIDLDKVTIEADVVKRISAEDALSLRALPICNTAAGLVVAIADPIDVIGTDRLFALLRNNLVLHLAPETALLTRIRSVFGLTDESSLTAYPEANAAPKRFKNLVSRLRFGSTAVFDAIDTHLDRKISLVCTPLDDPRISESLEIIKSAAKGAPGIAAVYDTVSDKKYRWTSIARLPGENLERVIKVRGPRQITHAAELVATTAESIDQIQRAGGQGDWVCPANIFLTNRGPVLAPIICPPQGYQSPSKDFDQDNPGSSTAFALGSLLRDCLNGFDRTKSIALPMPMNDILANSLAWEPKDRYGSAVEVAGALRSFNWAALQTPLGNNTAEEREHLLDTIEPTMHSAKPSFIDRLFRRRAA